MSVPFQTSVFMEPVKTSLVCSDATVRQDMNWTEVVVTAQVNIPKYATSCWIGEICLKMGWSPNGHQTESSLSMGNC